MAAKDDDESVKRKRKIIEFFRNQLLKKEYYAMTISLISQKIVDGYANAKAYRFADSQ